MKRPQHTFEFEVAHKAEDHTDHFPAPEEVQAEEPESEPRNTSSFLNLKPSAMN
jgi:hypothetical protein